MPVKGKLREGRRQLCLDVPRDVYRILRERAKKSGFSMTTMFTHIVRLFDQQNKKSEPKTLLLPPKEQEDNGTETA